MPDYLPPREIEIEQRLLASIFLDPELREKTFALIDADDFYDSGHQIVFRKCRELAQRGKPVGIDIVWAELDDNEQKKIGSAVKLSKLIDEIPLAPDINHYAGILKDRTARRRTLEYINSIEKRCHRKGSDLDKIERDAHLIIDEIQTAKAQTDRSSFEFIHNA
jgi:replicative DNA helicase